MGRAARRWSVAPRSSPSSARARPFGLLRATRQRRHYGAFSEGRSTARKLPDSLSKDYPAIPRILAIEITGRDIPGEIYLESTRRLVLSIKSRNPIATTTTAIDPIMTRRSAGDPTRWPTNEEHRINTTVSSPEMPTAGSIQVIMFRGETRRWLMTTAKLIAAMPAADITAATAIPFKP